MPGNVDIRRYGPLPLNWHHGHSHAMTDMHDAFRFLHPSLPTGPESWPELHRATLRKDMAGLRAALGSGSAVDETAQGGFTALHLAVYGEWDDGTRILLQAGADPHAVARDRITPVNLAAYLGADKILQNLLHRWREEWESSRPLRGYREPEGTISPLYLALSEGHPGCVRVLREAGCPRCANQLVFSATRRGEGWFPLSAVYQDRVYAAEAAGDSALMAGLRLCLDAITGHPGHFASAHTTRLPALRFTSV